MKMYLLFRLSLSLVFIVALLWGCTSKNDDEKNDAAVHGNIGLATMVDVTQGCSSRSLVTADGIKQALGIQYPRDFAPSVISHVTDITGVDLRPVKTSYLEERSAIENPNLRKKAVNSFVEGIVASVRDTSEGCVPKKASSIYKPLKSMVERLSEDTTLARTIIILVTDGMENSRVSFLKERGTAGNFDDRVSRLEKAYGEFPPIPGFEVILVHQPLEGDGIGTSGIEFWEKFLESKGAKVQLKAKI
jgi:hypothetical protein